MEKIEKLMDSLYSNEQSMMIFYFVLGAFALILIVLIIVTSIKIKKAGKQVTKKETDGSKNVSNDVITTSIPENNVVQENAEIDNKLESDNSNLVDSNKIENSKQSDDKVSEENDVYLEKEETVDLEPAIIEEEIKPNFEPDDYNFNDFKTDTITNIDELLSSAESKDESALKDNEESVKKEEVVINDEQEPTKEDNYIDSISDLKERLNNLRNVKSQVENSEISKEDNQELNDLMTTMGIESDDMPKLKEENMFKK